LTCQSCGMVSTTVDPFRDISLDLAPHMTTNRTSTPIDAQQVDSNSPASSTNSGETLLMSVPSSLYECLER
jgi:hypothetical protein